MDLGLEGKVAIVTGGSAGIGLAAARTLAREGARVVIAARTASTLAEAASSIREDTGGEIADVQADVSQDVDIERLIAATVERYRAAGCVGEQRRQVPRRAADDRDGRGVAGRPRSQSVRGARGRCGWPCRT